MNFVENTVKAVEDSFVNVLRDDIAPRLGQLMHHRITFSNDSKIFGLNTNMANGQYVSIRCDVHARTVNMAVFYDQGGFQVGGENTNVNKIEVEARKISFKTFDHRNSFYIKEAHRDSEVNISVPKRSFMYNLMCDEDRTFATLAGTDIKDVIFVPCSPIIQDMHDALFRLTVDLVWKKRIEILQSEYNRIMGVTK